MSLQSLRTHLTPKPKVIDDFAVGTVIRWSATFSGKSYIYVAVKATGGRWFTSARSADDYTPQVLSYEEMLERLSDPRVIGVQLADRWQTVTSQVVESGTYQDHVHRSL